MGHTVRIASYNVRDFKDDTEAAVRVIRAINPDVLCLQEVPRHPLSSYRIASFAARCGLYWSAGHTGSGGTTVMSSPRVDSADARHTSLRVARFQRERGYAVSRVRLPGHRSVSVVSVHLSLQAPERATHMATVLASIPEPEPLVLAGDLNEGVDGLAWAALARRLRVVTGDAPTFPAANPHRRIDVIFASSALSAGPGRPVDLDRADLLAATDHLPVWADLDLSTLALV